MGLKKPVGLQKTRALYGYLFILPFIIGFFAFMVKPMYQSLMMSLSDVTIAKGGFEVVKNNFSNYHRAFLVDPEFNRMLVESIQTMLYRSVATIVFSFFVAMILNQKFKGRTLARSIFFLAVILSSGVLVGLESSNALMSELQKTIEDTGNTASITDVLERVLVSTSGGVNGTSEKLFKILFDIIDSIYDVAMASGIQIIIFLSGLQNISPSMYEAADMEGCTSWEKLWKITVPMISPLLLVNWVYTIVDFFMKSDNVVMEKIKTVMLNLDYGFSASLAWSYFVVCMLFIGLTSLIISKVVNRD